MNTLQDLRATLDQHASGVHGDSTTARVAAVAGRARVVRRRRAAGVGAAAVVAVVVTGALALLPDREPGPADAPDALTVLGWRYEHQVTERTEGDRLSVDLPASDLPRVVSWSTTGADQGVEVRYDGERWNSEDADFDGFTQLPPGYSGEVSVRGPAGLALATYDLDTTSSPEGVGTGPTTFREDVAGYDFLGAGAGEPGQASVEVDVRPERGMIWLAYYCQGLPAGARIHVNWVGAEGAFIDNGGCDDGTTFDPGGSPGTGLTVAGRAGEVSAMRLWVTRGAEPVTDGEFPDLRLGLGLYDASPGAVSIAGIQMRAQVEHAGQVWELVDTATAGEGQVPQIQVPDRGRFLVAEAVRASARLRYAVSVDGRRVEGDTTFIGTGGGGGGLVRVPAGGVVSLRFGTPLDRVAGSGLALYQQVE